MREIIPNVFVGNSQDCYLAEPEFRILHACKSCHKHGTNFHPRDVPRDHPHYFFLRQDTALYLNLIDAPNPSLIPDNVMFAGIRFLDEAVEKGHPILVHCDRGNSRAPGLVLAWMRATGRVSEDNPTVAMAEFCDLSPDFNPSPGIQGWLEETWGKLPDLLRRSYSLSPRS